MTSRRQRGNQIVFVCNNWTTDIINAYTQTFELLCSQHKIYYAIWGKEIAPTTGTPHLQGYVAFVERTAFSTIRRLLPGSHIENARGDPSTNRVYCRKDGDFTEFGRFDSIPFQGKRSDIDKFKVWLLEQTSWPSDAHIAANWTSLYVRAGRRLLEIRELLYPKPALETGEYRDGWQSDLAQILDEIPDDDRAIRFYVDEEGNNGKTWFVRKYLTEKDDAQFFSIGKRDDIAHALDPTKRVFFFNVPRDGMQYLQYGILESIKDRLVFSPKYNSGTKRLVHNPHVIVFCNEFPDMTKLSEDRYNVIDIMQAY